MKVAHALREALRPLYVRMRRVVRFFTWIVPALAAVSLRGAPGRRRLLLIYDTSSQPFNIGDILLMQAGSLALRERHDLDSVDFVLVYDPRRPAPADPAFSAITESNALYHLASILPVAQANQHLGSLLLFDSHRNLERFIADNADLYQVWPSAWKFGSREYLYYEVFNDLLYGHYKKHGSVPRLTCRAFLADWAQAFYRKYVYPQVPVTVNLRNNPAFHTHRNSRMESWLEFFSHCEGRYPVKFVILCAFAEVDDRLRRCPNVIVAKDHHTGIEQDLALIHASAIHMGAGSGPVTMAWFSDKPYLMVNTAYGPRYFANPDMMIQEEENIQRFWFSSQSQRIASGVETTDLLVREFARMWAEADRARSQPLENPAEKTAGAVGAWLR